MLKIEGWEEEQDFPHGLVTIHEEFEVQILLIDNLHIMADGIDKEHEESTGFPVDEVLVLSPSTPLHPKSLHSLYMQLEFQGKLRTVRGLDPGESRVKRSLHQQDSEICLGQ